MVLDTQGGPNWFKNWCVAPVIVKPETDEVYFTPIYYVLSHFSKYIRPNAIRIGFVNTDTDLMVTSAKNPDGTIAVVVFNEGMEQKYFELKTSTSTTQSSNSPQEIQTILITNKQKKKYE